MKSFNEFAIDRNLNSISDLIKESYEDEYLKLSNKDKKRLLELDLEYGKLMLIARYETIVREVSNKEDEWEKFELNYIKKGIKYYPTLNHKPLKWKEYNLETRTKSLIKEFRNLNCYLTKFYIDNLEGILNKIDYLKTLDDRDFQPDITDKLLSFDKELVDEAEKIIKEHPYKEPTEEKYKKVLGAKEAAEEIKKKLDELGYDWKIVIKPNMLPRMGVNPEKTFRIRSHAKFSEVDIKSLVAHEIQSHVAKRYYGYETGLFLFVFGLDGKNIFDEGLAIWNTFNLIDDQKPNSYFKIAMSYIACYYCLQYDFCEAFDKLKKLVKGSDYTDKSIFSQLMRCKRSVINTDRLGCWSGDVDYFRGYKMVDKMTKAERDIILKYNIGPNQFFEVETIKKFLEINNIKPLTNEKVDEIKKEYEDLEE
ncbi:MAG: DUF1704 domain-containing protein [Erysipelotrichales bacterium]|nr:DUF1704 domain-containing protein [Erysipelotrichales bacterium]